MDYFFIIAIYAVVWWMVLFIVQPIGNAPEENPLPGFAPSAPKNPRIKQKLIWATVISVPVTAALYALILA